MNDNINPTLNELFDVQVDTVGLVTRGANRETFFLLKSADSAIDGTIDGTIKSADPTSPETAVKIDSGETAHELEMEKSIWQKFLTAVKGIVHKELAEMKTEPAPATTTVQEVAKEPESPPAAEVTAEKAETISPTPTGSSALPEVTPVAPAVEPVASTDGLSKQEITMPDTIAPVDVEKTELIAKMAALQERVDKAERDAAVEKELRERAVYLEKAQLLHAIPCDPKDLADHLFWLHKSDAKREEWLSAQLTAMDNMLADSNLFKDVGTTRLPEEATLIQKAEQMVKDGKAPDLKAALLGMSKRDAEIYIAKRQAATK